MKTTALDLAFEEIDTVAREQWTAQVDASLAKWQQVVLGNEELGFCHSGCDICDSGLAGDMHEALGQDVDGEWNELQACVDCIHYIANGEPPIDL